MNSLKHAQTQKSTYCTAQKTHLQSQEHNNTALTPTANNTSNPSHQGRCEQSKGQGNYIGILRIVVAILRNLRTPLQFCTIWMNSTCLGLHSDSQNKFGGWIQILIENGKQNVIFKKLKLLILLSQILKIKANTCTCNLLIW